jgi:hypothetical protein
VCAGDICSLSVFGNTFIILNSKRLAIEMLDKKSAKYSDRPVFRKFSPPLWFLAIAHSCSIFFR